MTKDEKSGEKLPMYGLFKAAALTARFLTNKISPEEVQTLKRWLIKDKKHLNWLQALFNEETILQALEDLNLLDSGIAEEFRKLLAKIGIDTEQADDASPDFGNDIKLLIRELNKGNRQAFGLIFNDYYGTIFNVAKKILHDDEIAKDIAAETFFKVWKKNKNFQNISHLRSFLYKITRRLCFTYIKRNQLKKEHRQEMAYLMSQVEMEDIIMSKIFASEVLRTLKQAIEKLPPQSRKVIKLQLKGIKTGEIAIRLNISVQTVRNTKVKAITTLKSLMTTSQ